MLLTNATQNFSTYWRPYFLEVNVMRPAIAKRLHTPGLDISDLNMCSKCTEN